MPDKIHIRRESNDIPFGFKLAGGAEFSDPLHIASVAPHSIAEYSGLRPGDAVVEVNNIKIITLEHSLAKSEILRAGNEFTLTIVR